MAVMCSEPRYEFKMVYAATSLPEVHSWVRLHSAGFRQAYPPRRVNNIYFDTADSDTFYDHVDGIGVRRKLRFRWYGESFAFQGGTLEIKHKAARVGRKLTQRITCPLDLAALDWAAVRRALLAQAEEGFCELLPVVIPTLINHYRREYYVSADGKTRLTLDYDLRAFCQHAAAPNIRYPVPPEEVMLIEFKRGLEDEASFAALLAEFPQRVTRYSKYVDSFGSGL